MTAINATCAQQTSPPCYDFDTGLNVEPGAYLTIQPSPSSEWMYNASWSSDSHGHSDDLLPGRSSLPNGWGQLMMRISNQTAIVQNPQLPPDDAYYSVVGSVFSLQVATWGRLTLAYNSPDNVGHFGSILVGLVYIPPLSAITASLSNGAYSVDLPANIPTSLPLAITPASFHVIRYTSVAQDTLASRTWTIRIIRTDDVLSELTFSAGVLQPPFMPNIQSYVLGVPYGTSAVTATATRPTALSTVVIDCKLNSVSYLKSGIARDYDTGIQVRPGGWLSITTDPLSTVVLAPGVQINADGVRLPYNTMLINPGSTSAGFAPLYQGTLVGRIGPKGSTANPISSALFGTYFAIGSSFRMMMNVTGYLYLAVMDSDASNNSGNYTSLVTYTDPNAAAVTIDVFAAQNCMDLGTSTHAL